MSTYLKLSKYVIEKVKNKSVTLGMITINALACADSVLIPVLVSYTGSNLFWGESKNNDF